METPSEALQSNLQLQRFFISPEDKKNKEKGKAIIKSFFSNQNSGTTGGDSSLNFFQGRSARWAQLWEWSVGTQSVQPFLDYISVSDSNKSYVNLDLTPTRVGAQFVYTIIEVMAKYKLFASVDAIDDGSISEKEDKLLEAIFRMREVELINDVQQQAGVQLEPANAFVPDSELAAKVYLESEDRLPKEIRFEKVVAMVQNNIDFEMVANRQTLRNMVVTNCGVVQVEKLGVGQYTATVHEPGNVIYNFFMNDTGKLQISEIGVLYSLKVKDIRSRFGQSNSNQSGLTEQEIFELARLSTNKNVGKNGLSFSHVWQTDWGLSDYGYDRPYDDLVINVFDCEIDFCEEEYYVNKKDAYGKDNITAKKSIPYQQKTKDGKIINQEKPDDVEIIKKPKNTWMRGVYAPYGDKMLYWGRPDVIITPYTNVSKPLSSWCINIPGNNGKYVPSLFERIIEPLREYQVTKLKRKQLIAKIKPTGIRIDVESARNLDLGNGNTIDWEEVMRIYDQTGNEIWSSKGIDPLQQERPPLSNTVRNETIQDIIGLSNVMQGQINEMRMLIGSSMYLEGADVGERTAAKLAEAQTDNASNVFGYVLNGNAQLWQEVFYKICLLHWNDVVKQEPESSEDMINTRFDLKIKMRNIEFEKQLLEADIQRYSQVPDAQNNPSLSPKDAMMIREIEDPKSARLYLTNVYEENRRNAIEDAQRNVAENAKAQEQSLMKKGEIDMQMQADKLTAEKDMVEFKSVREKELSLLNGLMQAIGKGVISPDIVMPAIQQLVPNISIPLTMENKQMTDGIIAQAQEQQATQMADQMTEEEMMMANGEGQPQMQPM